MRLLVDAHVFDGKFQGTRTYIEGIYTNLVKHADIDFYFAAYNIDILKKVFGETGNIHYVKLNSKNNIIRLAVEFPSIIKRLNIDFAHFQYISPLFKDVKRLSLFMIYCFWIIPNISQSHIGLKIGFYSNVPQRELICY